MPCLSDQIYFQHSDTSNKKTRSCIIIFDCNAKEFSKTDYQTKKNKL